MSKMKIAGVDKEENISVKVSRSLKEDREIQE
jgi:hypothetical protein